jgi:hypothetical protein
LFLTWFANGSQREAVIGTFNGADFFDFINVVMAFLLSNSLVLYVMEKVWIIVPGCDSVFVIFQCNIRANIVRGPTGKESPGLPGLSIACLPEL